MAVLGFGRWHGASFSSYTPNMADELLNGWRVDLPRLYGEAEWKRLQRFHCGQMLWPVEGRDLAVILFAIGEVGVGKQVGRLAVLADQHSPRPVFEAGLTIFWELGDQTLRFSKDGNIAYCYEFGEVRDKPDSNPSAFSCRLWGLDFQWRQTGRLPRESKGFDLRPDELAALQWNRWPRS